MSKKKKTLWKTISGEDKPFIAQPLNHGVEVRIEEPVETEEFEAIGYGQGGKILDANSKHAFAKKAIGSNNEDIYFVRVGTFGHVSGQFYDPWSNTYPSKTAEWASAVGDNGTRRFEWRRVSKDCFDSYNQFLRGKNARCLLQAQRMGTL
jgi:hypothetical protein